MNSAAMAISSGGSIGTAVLGIRATMLYFHRFDPNPCYACFLASSPVTIGDTATQLR